jgi:mannosyltransferase
MKTIRIIWIITIIAAALRLYHLDFNSVWLDEAFTFFYTHQNGYLDIFLHTADDCHPALSYWLIKSCQSVFGVGDATLRLVPAIAGILTVPVFYYIGREISESAGILMALFLTVNRFHIAYSQEARMYTLLLLLFSVGMLYYIRQDYLKSAIAFGLCLWTQFYSAVSFAILWVFQSKDWIKSLTVYSLIAAPLTWFIIQIFTKKTATGVMWGWPGLILISHTVIQMFGYETLFAGIAVVLAVIGLLWVQEYRRDLMPITGWYLLAGAVVSIIISYTMSMTPRYLITALPVLLLLVTVSVKYHKLAWVLVIILLIGNIAGLPDYYTVPIKDDWRPIPSIIGDAPTAVIGPQFANTFESYARYHSLPLWYYCPTCNITDIDDAEYVVLVNNAEAPGELVYNSGGLRISTPVV